MSRVAPVSINLAAQSECPALAAQCRGVSPTWPLTLTFDPPLIIKDNIINTDCSDTNFNGSNFTNLTIKRDVDVYSLIRSTLEFAVKKRVYNCERDIACLLSLHNHHL